MSAPSAAVVKILNEASKKYLESGQGWKSWFDAQGFDRAQKLVKFTEMPEIHRHEDYGFLLLKALYKTSSKSLINI